MKSNRRQKEPTDDAIREDSASEEREQHDPLLGDRSVAGSSSSMSQGLSAKSSGAEAEEARSENDGEAAAGSAKKESCEPIEPGESATRDSGLHHRLPQPAVGRLSLYYRELIRLLDEGGVSLNSQELGQLVNVSPAVCRRDLSALGTIGRRGVGYDIAVLVDRIGRVLGSGVQWNVVLVGVGSLGHALLRYRGFDRLGFHLSAAFDNDPKLIGTEIGGIEVLNAASLESVLRVERAELAILALPAEHAADVAAKLLKCEIKGILNFAPTTLSLGSDVAVVNVDLASELQRLVFAVQSQKL